MNSQTFTEIIVNAQIGSGIFLIVVFSLLILLQINENKRISKNKH